MGKMLYSETVLQADSARYSDVHNKACQWCLGGVVENAAHLLFDCPRFQDVRRRKWDEVTGIMPEAMVQSIRLCSSNDKIKFIFTGLNGAKYNSEWEDIYDAIVDFVYCVYKARRDVEL